MAEATTVNMEMTSDRSAITDAGRIVPAGTRVTYIAHVVGGCVRVRLPDGAINFRAFGGVTCHADRAVGKVREDWPVMLKTALRRWSQVTPAFGCVMQRVEQTALQAVPSEFESRTQRCTGD
jgi:hypothetical protein